MQDISDDESRAKRNARRKANSAKVTERERAWYAKNKEKINAQRKQRDNAPERRALLNERARAYRKRHKDKVSIENARPARRKKNKLAKIFSSFGLTEVEYQWKYDEQRGRCAICEAPVDIEAGPRRWDVAVIDHCHQTNKVRGLLCNSCNTGLGHLKDDVNILRKAIKYLKFWGSI